MMKRTVQLNFKVGTPFSLYLTAATGGGYDWYFEYDESKLELIDTVTTLEEELEWNLAGRPVGGPTEYIHIFRGLVEGEVEMIARHKRIWDEDSTVEEVTYKFTFHGS